MRRPVRWTRRALDDLKRQIDYLATANSAAARNVAARITATAAMMGERAIGRASKTFDVFEKSVIGLPYFLVYRIRVVANVESVQILRVIHTAQDWPGKT